MPNVNTPDLCNSTFFQEANKTPYTRQELELVLDWMEKQKSDNIKRKNELKSESVSFKYSNGDYCSS